MHVLEAGCAEGKDAARFGPKVASWTGYDFMPEFLEIARQRVPSCEFVERHSGKEPAPKRLHHRFDLVVSRRGPTSVIDHLHSICRPNANVLCIHPWDDGIQHKILARLAAVGLTPKAEWFSSVNGWLPTLEDFLAFRQFALDARTEPELIEVWNAERTAKGWASQEKRYIWLTQLGASDCSNAF